MSSNLYAIRKKYRTQARQTEREYSNQALENTGEAIMTALEKPGEWLRESISGDPDSFGIPEFEFNANVGNRAGYRGEVTVDEEVAEGAAKVVFDPVNLVGAGLFRNGVKAAQQISGPNSLSGNMLSAARNFIPNNYGPSGTAVPTVVDELIMANQQSLSQLPKIGPKIDRLDSTKDSANLREKTSSAVNWGLGSAFNGVEQVLSPRARANFRENQVTNTMQTTAREARQSGLPRDEAKAVAQNTYTTNVRQQAGGSGGSMEAVDDLNRRSFLTDPVPVTTDAYKSLIKDNKLQGTYESGKTFSVSDKDLDIISSHVSRVWKDPKGRTLLESPDANIRIKNAGAGDQVTGQHHFDFQSKSGIITSFKNVFKNGPISEEELWKQAKKKSDENKIFNAKRNKDKTPARWVLTERSSTLEGAKEHGLWVTGSFSGNAITEGGVNFIAKVSPNGRVMGVISDEHNFLEKAPVLGPILEASLPSRALSVTPPMHFDLGVGRQKVKPVQPKDKKNVRESLFDIERAEPSAEALSAERRVNAGAALVTGRMLTGGNEDEN